MKPWTIAIDGPAGAGKSTVARRLAARLGYLYIDSGAMYRAIAFKALQSRVPTSEPDQISALARSVRIDFQPAVADGSDDEQEQRVLLDGQEVTEAIRAPDVSAFASQVSAIPGVRAAMVAQQQTVGAHGGVVMEGRDIGTVVFPNAEVKVFLTASPEERAARRHKDRLARGDAAATLEQVRAEQDERDKRDSTRSVSPLLPAADAVVIESDDMVPDDVVDSILDIIDARRREA